MNTCWRHSCVFSFIKKGEISLKGGDIILVSGDVYFDCLFLNIVIWWYMFDDTFIVVDLLFMIMMIDDYVFDVKILIYWYSVTIQYWLLYLHVLGLVTCLLVIIVYLIDILSMHETLFVWNNKKHENLLVYTILFLYYSVFIYCSDLKSFSKSWKTFCSMILCYSYHFFNSY